MIKNVFRFSYSCFKNGLCSAKLGDFFEKIEEKMDNIVFFMYFCKKFD